MARNQEKKLELFSKWDQFRKDSASGLVNKKGRPGFTQDCDSIGDAEKYRREIIREVTKKISAIHNASLGEYRIRELNDEINKMMSKKHHWEKRIRELGGQDYKKIKTALHDIEGKALPGAPYYKYYGAAKELPGVRELFNEEEDFYQARRNKKSASKKISELYKNITPDYYGFRDDDDGVLIPKEATQQVKRVNSRLNEFRDKKRKLEEEIKESNGHFGGDELQRITDKGDVDELNFLLDRKFRESYIEKMIKSNQLVAEKAKVPVTSMEDIVAMKKRELLSQYA